MQGDIYRAKQKEREKYSDKSVGHYSQILSGVDDMRINDIITDNYNSTSYKDYNDVNHYDEEDGDVSLNFLSYVNTSKGLGCLTEDGSHRSYHFIDSVTVTTLETTLPVNSDIKQPNKKTSV